MPIGPKKMPFLDHLEELRRRLVRVIITVGILSVIIYTWAWQVFNFVMAPVSGLLPREAYHTFGPFEGFTVRFKVALFAAVVIGSPVIIWHTMAFFLPALKENERRYVVPTFIAAVALFAAGVVFCYKLVLYYGFSWMIDQGAKNVTVFADAERFFQGVMYLLVGFGIGFEIPIVVFYLMIFNIVPYATLRKNWRYSYIAIGLIAALATPDWSPYTIGFLFVALVVLYEGAMLLARVVLAKRIAQQKRLAAGDIETVEPA